MTDRELMQQALEALEFFWDNGYRNIAMKQKAAMNALRERLAQPEQEPVAWMQEMPTKGDETRSVRLTTIEALAREEWASPIPLYTTPPRRDWVGLTKEEAKEISLANRPYVVDMIAALEARLKEKNT